MTIQVIPSPAPNRHPNGVTTEPTYGPLAQYGLRNPFFYHEIEDDFDTVLSKDGLWTPYEKSSGTIALTSGDGGRLLFTTAATSGDVVAIQSPVANIALLTGKKTFFLTRLQMSSIAGTGPTVIAGLIDVTATPNLTITDGLYFSINAGEATFYATVGSVATSVALPTTAYATQTNPAATTMAVNVDYDMGFYVDRNQNVHVFFGQQLVGFSKQSGSGVIYPATGVSVWPVIGEVAELNQSVTAVTLTTATLAPTLILEEGTGSAAVTMNADFIMAARER